MKIARVIATNAVVKVISMNGGWTTVQDADGKSAKLRNKQLQMLTPEEIAALSAIVVPPVTKAVDPDLVRYTTHPIKTPSGRKAVDIADPAADILRGQALEDCYFIVAKHVSKSGRRAGDEVDEAEVDKQEAALKAKYKHLNAGMQRMNLGNVLRKAMGIYGNLNAHKRIKPVKPVKQSGQ